jgi:hypothetical protein
VQGVTVEGDSQGVVLGGGLGADLDEQAGPVGAWRMNTEASSAWAQATGQPSAVSMVVISMSRTCDAAAD